MEPQVWIGIQILIDLAMLGLLVWFLRSGSARQISLQDHEAAMQKSKAILDEMREITQALERNLVEKKELGEHILAQLDQGLKRAEETSLKISEINRCAGNLANRAYKMQEADRTLTEIKTFLGRGMSREEIAQRLKISVGEIELLLKFHSQREKS